MTSNSKIDPAIFGKNADIRELLQNSDFYPASGTDLGNIHLLLSKGVKSFVRADYSTSGEITKMATIEGLASKALQLDVLKLAKGYELIKPGNFSAEIPLNDHERNRLARHYNIKKCYDKKKISYFEIRCTFGPNAKTLQEQNGHAKQFLLLHIGSEACEVFEALYLAHKINPKTITIIEPAEGYGDNWTEFTNPDFRLYKMLKMNCEINGQWMPEYLLTDRTFRKEAFWPGYVFHEEYPHEKKLLYLFKYQP